MAAKNGESKPVPRAERVKEGLELVLQRLPEVPPPPDKPFPEPPPGLKPPFDVAQCPIPNPQSRRSRLS